MGGNNYDTKATEKREISWKEKYKDRYLVTVAKVVSLDVVAHDLQAWGATIVEKFNVMHALIINLPIELIPLANTVEYVIEIRPQYDLKALHG